MLGPCACCSGTLQLGPGAVVQDIPLGHVVMGHGASSLGHGAAGPGTIYLLTTQPHHHQQSQQQPMTLHPHQQQLPAAGPLQPTMTTFATPTIGRGVVQAVSYGPPNPLFGGMEAVWHCEFQKLFAHFFNTHSQVWFLSPVAGPVAAWHPFLDSAKVRFCCQECGHGWTSMKGRVAFWFSFNSVHQEGHIAFKLYGQKCQRCKTENYENAMWYPEEVSKVMANLFYRIGHTCYGLYQASYAKNRRPGKPRTPHNSDLCQACQDGICSERR